MCIYIYIYIYIYIEREREIYIYIYIYISLEAFSQGVVLEARRSAGEACREEAQYCFGAPIPKMSLGDKTSLHVISIYSDKQQLSHNIGWPVTHVHTYMRACRPAYSHVDIRSISEISSCFFRPRPWHIEIRHRVKKTSTINLFGFETLKLRIRRLKLWKLTVHTCMRPQAAKITLQLEAVADAFQEDFATL